MAKTTKSGQHLVRVQQAMSSVGHHQSFSHPPRTFPCLPAATYEPSVSMAFGLPGIVVQINHILYVLDNDVCQGRGEATYLFSGPPVCECTTAKYYGPTCGEYCDPQETCNGRGECDEEGRCDCESGLWADNGVDCNTFSEVVLIGAGITLCLLVVIIVVVVILIKRRSRKETSYALLVDDELMDY
eukprot:TRINITY_DN1103_c0_g1_i1.p1 TRINITY_DN1103_c0_g1~~TRINITY_DN1103_c0_g1_i1.p1  ORF type:complete len:186 (+),score=21.31 TRINITY_DN1103_c0_g1_i1:335-892(+)